MLAEQASYTELALPEALQDKAIVLAGEPSWPALEAVQVVDWLEAHGREVAGVEVWRDKEGKPLFVAASDYSLPPDAQVTPESVTWCAYKARVFIAKFDHEQEGLFNVSASDGLADLGKPNAASAPRLPNYSRVRLSTDKYESEGALCFDIGYIIEVYPENKYEIEFSNTDGVTTAQIVAGGEELQLAPPIVPAPARSLSLSPIEEHKL